MMTEIKKLTYLLRDFPLFVLVGISAGILGYAFRQSIAWAGTVRYQYPKLIFLLPFAAILVTALYRLILSGYKNGPKTVIKAVRDNGKINSVQLPLVFLASCLTHLTGGSAGREGAVLEMGGIIGDGAVRLLRNSGRKRFCCHNVHLLSPDESYETQRRVSILCGMAGAFSALFVTPLAAVFFVLEVTDSRQILHRFVPVFTTSMIAFIVVCLLGWEPTRIPYHLPAVMPPGFLLRTALLAAVCSLVGRFFCLAVRGVPRFARFCLKQEYARALLFSAAVVLLTFLLKTFKYNGLGIEAINNALLGKAGCGDFFWKTIMTALTLAAGLKGGEIIPALFVGATFGAAFSPFIGFLPDLGAAVGMVGVLTAVAKVPVAAFFLGVELFGAEGAFFYGVASIICLFLSGKKGLYN